MQKYQELRLILGDQLSMQHSWFKEKNNHVVYLIAELHQEAHYVKHHAQKLLAFFAAMQDFACLLEKQGHQVIYLTLDDTQQYSSLTALLSDIVQRFHIKEMRYQHPDEFRLYQQMQQLQKQLSIPVYKDETEHFLIPMSLLGQHFKKNKSQRMEAFYRRCRKQFNILMEDNEPEGGQWNFDQSNRKKLKRNELNLIPKPLLFKNNVSSISDRIKQHKIPYLGDLTDTLLWPINRQQALKLLSFFCQHALPYFGHFQDAMTCQASAQQTNLNWSLFHSRLSFALNTKMLSPLEVVDSAIQSYRQNTHIDCAQVEGFVRQIIGWREFIRGIYWINMPAYKQLNQLKANRDLPRWFWTGKTKMRCMAEAIGQSLSFSYAHHIQRLMVTGNFCLLTGIDPDQVDQWYLGIYIDAIEWVELPNTRGMSQFADGGIVASKAYAASGNYINKMSDYCGHCHYQVKAKTSDDACPLNALYWYFLVKHQNQFATNPRQAMIYKTWQKQPPTEQKAILAKAESLLINIEQL